MARCNHCMLQDFKKVAENAGGTVLVEPAPREFAPGGCEIFIRYPGVDLPVWCAWFMALPDRCAC